MRAKIDFYVSPFLRLLELSTIFKKDDDFTNDLVWGLYQISTNIIGINKSVDYLLAR